MEHVVGLIKIKNIAPIVFKPTLSQRLDTTDLAGDIKWKPAQVTSRKRTSDSSSCVVLGKNLETRDITRRHLPLLGTDAGIATNATKITDSHQLSTKDFKFTNTSQTLEQVTVNKPQLLISVSLASSIIDSSDTPTKLTAASRIRTRSDTSIGLLTSCDFDTDLVTLKREAEHTILGKLSKSE